MAPAKRSVLTIRLSKELHRDACLLAAAKGLSVNAYLEWLLQRDMEAPQAKELLAQGTRYRAAHGRH